MTAAAPPGRAKVVPLTAPVEVVEREVTRTPNEAVSCAAVKVGKRRIKTKLRNLFIKFLTKIHVRIYSKYL